MQTSRFIVSFAWKLAGPHQGQRSYIETSVLLLRYDLLCLHPIISLSFLLQLPNHLGTFRQVILPNYQHQSHSKNPSWSQSRMSLLSESIISSLSYLFIGANIPDRLLVPWVPLFSRPSSTQANSMSLQYPVKGPNRLSPHP